MYLRHGTVEKNGKTHTYWRLVRSVRRGGKVVQETVAQLGELDEQGRARAREVALAITGGREQCELFETPCPTSEPAPVQLDKVRLERGRRFGDVWLGWTLWRALELDAFCESRMPCGREKVPWATMAAILVIARLCKPSSELHIAEHWYRQTALADLLGVPDELVNDDRLYRALDQLVEHKDALQQHLVKRLGELFSLDYELLLYDVTSTYFEGQAARNPMAKRGHSRDHRPDCKQVCIALVVVYGKSNALILHQIRSEALVPPKEHPSYDPTQSCAALGLRLADMSLRMQPAASPALAHHPPFPARLLEPEPSGCHHGPSDALALHPGGARRLGPPGQLKVIEYLQAENRALREQLGNKRLRFTDDQRRRLAVKGHALGRKALRELGCIVTPDTILRWYRELIAEKYDGSEQRKMGRPRAPD